MTTGTKTQTLGLVDETIHEGDVIANLDDPKTWGDLVVTSVAKDLSMVYLCVRGRKDKPTQAPLANLIAHNWQYVERGAQGRPATATEQRGHDAFYGVNESDEDLLKGRYPNGCTLREAIDFFETQTETAHDAVMIEKAAEKVETVVKERIAKEFENKEKPRIVIDARNGLVNAIYATKGLLPNVDVVIVTERDGTKGSFSTDIQCEYVGGIHYLENMDGEVIAAIEEYDREPDPDDDTQCPDCGSKWDAGGPLAGTVCPTCHRGVVEVQR